MSVQHDKPKKPQPVYDAVAVEGVFIIHRDGKPMVTPAEKVFAVSTSALANMIVEEWRAQSGKPNPATMPFTQLAATAIDVVAPKRQTIIDSIAAYAESDLLCHRTEEPPRLTAQQGQIWQPWLDWAKKRYGAELKSGHGIMPVAQSETSLKNLRAAVEACDAFTLAGLQQAVSVSGSLILGLALREGQATPAAIFAAAELDSLHQMQQWGEDPVTVERHNSVKRELALCEQWFRLLHKV